MCWKEYGKHRVIAKPAYTERFLALGEAREKIGQDPAELKSLATDQRY